MLVVRLDDPRYGAGPGTVIAQVDSVAEYHVMITDRDGAMDDRMRLWTGAVPVGTRVVMKQMEAGA